MVSSRTPFSSSVRRSSPNRAGDDLVEHRIRERFRVRTAVRLTVVFLDPRRVGAPGDVRVNGADVEEERLRQVLQHPRRRRLAQIFGFEPELLGDVVVQHIPAVAESPRRADEAVAHEPGGLLPEGLQRLGQDEQRRRELRIVLDEVVLRRIHAGEEARV